MIERNNNYISFISLIIKYLITHPSNVQHDNTKLPNKGYKEQQNKEIYITIFLYYNTGMGDNLREQQKKK